MGIDLVRLIFSRKIWVWRLLIILKSWIGFFLKEIFVFCVSRSSVTPGPCKLSLSIFPVAPFRYWKAIIRWPQHLTFRGQYLSHPARSGKAFDAVCIILCIFMLGLKCVPRCCTFEMAPGGLWALLAAVPTFPVNYPSALVLLLLGGPSRLKVDGVKSPLVPHCIQFGGFTVSEQYFCSVRHPHTEKSPREPSETEKHRNSKHVSIYRILFYCTSPNVVLQGNWNKSAMTLGRKVRGHGL